MCHGGNKSPSAHAITRSIAVHRTVCYIPDRTSRLHRICIDTLSQACARVGRSLPSQHGCSTYIHSQKIHTVRMPTLMHRYVRMQVCPPISSAFRISRQRATAGIGGHGASSADCRAWIAAFFSVTPVARLGSPSARTHQPSLQLYPPSAVRSIHALRVSHLVTTSPTPTPRHRVPHSHS